MVKLIKYGWPLLLGFFPIVLLGAEKHDSTFIYSPKLLIKREIKKKNNFISIANTFLSIPYREDGTLNRFGNFSTFKEPIDTTYSTPGLNCSGFVLSLSRYLLKKNFVIANAIADIKNDSGNHAIMGKDWDYGWDLIMNLSKDFPRKVIQPGGNNYALNAVDGLSLRGFDLTDLNAWKEVFYHMHPGNVYLASISKPTKRRGYRLIHYHVGIILVSLSHQAWFYHTTTKAHTHRLKISHHKDMSLFQTEFNNPKRSVPKSILIIEIQLDS